MQSASANFAAAISASSGVWAAPQVHADWANDGYGGDGTIDDLSLQEGRAIVINQAMDDGMPSDVSAVTGKDPTSTVQFPAGGKVVSGVLLSGPQYWSLDNTSSPISAYDRDVAALTVAHGLVTAGGIERVTVFTGQMSDAPVSGRAATVMGVSKTRLKMTKTVQPAPIIGDWMGLEATWPVSWALAQCGIYVSPPPRSGCRLWIPMHGSTQPFLPNTPRKTIGSVVSDVTGGNPTVRPSFIDGPYLAAVNLGRTFANPNRLSTGGLPVAAGTDLLSKNASAGRLEFWVRGDAVDNSISTPPTTLVNLFVAPGSPTIASGGVDINRHVFLEINDGTNDITYTSSGTLPTDGAWYFVGVAWDVVNKKLWLNLNGTVSSSTFSALTTSTLVASESFNPDNTSVSSVQMSARLPIAEVHLTSGAQANADNFPWLNDAAYTATWSVGAVLKRSNLQLFALGEQKPREVWEFVNSFAQAELASVRTDELDRFWYLPLSYWVATAQQTVGDAWSTLVNAGKDFQVTRDPSKIRNQVTVTYTDSRLGHYLLAQNDFVAVDFTQRTLNPGTTVVTLQFGSPVATVEYLADPFLLIDGTYTSPPVRSFLSANTATDGSGSYATTGQLVANITRWDAGSCDVTIVNTTNTTFYTIHPTLQYINIAGAFLTQVKTASVTVNDTVSQSARGVRGLSVSLPAITDKTTATWVAGEILARSRVARKVLEVTLRGDPRRQPGDLVTFTDPGNTQLGGSWRVMAITHTIDAARYEQDVTAVQYWPVATWDQTNWDQSLWGP
jgi:putative tail protein